MRIGLNTPDTQSVSTEQAKKPSTAVTNQPEVSSSADKNTLSQDRVTLSALASQALGMPEVRQATVDSLRQSVSSGQYQLDPNDIADAILRGARNSGQN
jgi:flagellar biosynthesis anti-sigma factor FlgM